MRSERTTISLSMPVTLKSDIRRKVAGDRVVQETFVLPLSKVAQMRGQKQRQRGLKFYSWHAPETESIGK